MWPTWLKSSTVSLPTPEEVKAAFTSTVGQAEVAIADVKADLTRGEAEIATWSRWHMMAAGVGLTLTLAVIFLLGVWLERVRDKPRVEVTPVITNDLANLRGVVTLRDTQLEQLRTAMQKANQQLNDAQRQVRALQAQLDTCGLRSDEEIDQLNSGKKR